MLNKNLITELLLFLLKTIIFIVGLDIFLTTISIVINEDFNKNNLGSEINLKNIKDKYDQNFQFVRDIY